MAVDADRARLGVGARERRVEGELARLRARDAHGDHPVGIAREDLPREARVVGRVADAGDRLVDVELAAVAGGLQMVGEGEVEVAEGLVELLAQRLAHHVLRGEALGLALLAFEEELAHLGQILGGALVLIVLGLASPEGVLVELDALDVDAAEDHGAHPPVAHGQRLDPLACRPAVPQHQFPVGCAHLFVSFDDCIAQWPTRWPAAPAAAARPGDRLSDGRLRRLRVCLAQRLGILGRLRPGRIVARAKLPGARQRESLLAQEQPRLAPHDPAAARLVVDPHRNQIPAPWPDGLRGHLVAAVGVGQAVVLGRHRAGCADLDAVDEGLIAVVHRPQLEVEGLPFPLGGDLHEAAIPGEAVVALERPASILPEARNSDRLPALGSACKGAKRGGQQQPRRQCASHAESPFAPASRNPNCAS